MRTMRIAGLASILAGVLLGGTAAQAQDGPAPAPGVSYTVPAVAAAASTSTARPMVRRAGPGGDPRWHGTGRPQRRWIGYRQPGDWNRPRVIVRYGTPFGYAPYGYGWPGYSMPQSYDSRDDGGWDGYYDDDADVRDMPPPPEGPPPGHGHHGYPDDGVTWHGQEYSGRWTGTWQGADGRVYSGTYEGTYQGTAPGPRDDGPPPPRHPHPQDGPPQLPYGDVYSFGGYGGGYSGGYAAGGYYYPAPTVTTVVVQPAVETTTYVEEEVVRTPPRRTWRPRKKAAARQGCVCK